MKRIINIIIVTVFLMTLVLTVVSACGGKNDESAMSTEPEMLLGMYHIDPDLDDADNAIKTIDAINGDMFNVFLLGTQPVGDYENVDAEKFDYFAQKIYDAGKKFWLFGYMYMWVYQPTMRLRPDAYPRLAELKQYIESKPYYEAFLGIKIDEPLFGGLTVEGLYEGTKAYNATFPDKRFYANFTAMAFNPNLPFSGDRMTSAAGKYITDISYDMYGEYTVEHTETYKYMVDMFKGQGKKFWAVPLAMSYKGYTTEDDALKHVNEFYKLIKSTKGGVGMMLYGAYTIPYDREPLGNIGFGDLLVSTETFKGWKNLPKPYSDYYSRFYDTQGNPINGGFVPWNRLNDRIKEIYAEINAHNTANFSKKTPNITVEDNAVFYYDGTPKLPSVTPKNFDVNITVASANSGGYTDEMPVEPGSYFAKISFDGDKYYVPFEKTVKFSIVEDTENTLIASEHIVETYSSARQEIAVNRDGLEYSSDGVSYAPYAKGTAIDVSGLIIVQGEGLQKNLYFREQNKAPYIYRIKSYVSTLFADFNSDAKLYSGTQFQKSAVIKYEGKQSAYFDSQKMGSTTGGLTQYTVYMQDTDMVAKGGIYSFQTVRAIKLYVYAEQELSFTMQFMSPQWKSCETKKTYTVPAQTWTEVTVNVSANDLKPISGTPAEVMPNLTCWFITATENVPFYVDYMRTIELF